jgi:hypothetical protein
MLQVCFFIICNYCILFRGKIKLKEMIAKTWIAALKVGHVLDNIMKPVECSSSGYDGSSPY